MSEPSSRGAERDLFRDTWVRYLGYANEVGEAFRSLVPAAVVWLSYGVASSYVLADAIDKGKKAGKVPSPEAGRSARVTVAVVDTFVWQALASVAIPGFTINRVCATSLYVLGTATRWPLAVRKWTTTALGLLVIPIIIHPIDRWVSGLPPGLQPAQALPLSGEAQLLLTPPWYLSCALAHSLLCSNLLLLLGDADARRPGVRGCGI
ncbi:hypothetical protein HPG69_019159 [Diceros bicornis minor]|uniref:Mitochondrial fission process protein 1 n=1 Tax=Diceros bicornis minor TaxID=77932 RepID=A0A7J7FM58_DICBM|nr:hypothetical protein HPG69_019159 [Diceros bicornis minor]